MYGGSEAVAFSSTLGKVCPPLEVGGIGIACTVLTSIPPLVPGTLTTYEGGSLTGTACFGVGCSCLGGIRSPGACRMDGFGLATLAGTGGGGFFTGPAVDERMPLPAVWA